MEIIELHRSNSETVSVLFSWAVALTPLMYSYASISQQISVADLMLILFSMYFFINFFLNGALWKPKFTPLIMFVFYLIISTLFSVLLFNLLYINTMIARWAKFLLFIFSISIFPNYLKEDHFRKGLRFVCIVSAATIFLQYVLFYTFRYTKSFKIPLLSFVTDESQKTFSLVSFRPSAFFLEPAHLVYCLALYLAYIMFSDAAAYKLPSSSVFLTAAIILSTSSTGIVLVVILWTLYLARVLSRWRNPRRIAATLIFAVIIIGAFVTIVLSTPIFYKSISRISYPESVAVTGRTNAGLIYVQSLKGLEKWIGLGFGNLSQHVYFSSMNYFRYCSGYLGIVMFLYLLLRAFAGTSLSGRVVLIMLLLTSFSSGILMSALIVPYAAVVYFGFKEKHAFNSKQARSSKHGLTG